jgi:exodeoxyribonuclease VII large subunit
LTGLPSALPSALTVSQLTRLVRDTLRGILPPVLSVVGQISNFRPASGGHAWFTLKDDQAQLSCVIWADKFRRLRFKPQDGLEVVASGNIDVYASQGRYQLYIERLEPVGVGALELAIRQLYEKHQKEGLFDATHKQP